MNAAVTHARIYALLADGTTIEVRSAGPADHDAVRQMHAAMSPDNVYLHRGDRLRGRRPHAWPRGGDAPA